MGQTMLRGSICDYGLQILFQKSASLLDPPGALALFCLILFGVFFFMLLSVALWKRAPWKPPTHRQQDGQAVLCCPVGVLTLSACQWLKGCIFNSAELKERSQHMFFLFFVCFNQCPRSLPLILAHILYGCFWIYVSYFMVFWIAQDQLF